MIALRLSRMVEANGATLGVLTGLSRPLYTVEEAWRGNKPKVSCIPVGTYRCVPHGWEPNTTVSKPKTWQLLNVPGRNAILIHVGNTTKDTEGCILAGLGMSVSQLVSSVSDSRMALDLLRKEIGQQEFTLTVEAI